LLDYDDLLIQCAKLLRRHPGCVANIEAVLIDEFQDTNTIQLELMKLLANKHGRVTIVGDPDQSIYGFRSAEVQNLTRMQQYYPDTSIINLEENYRSSAAVLRCAQEVIEQDSARPNKRLKATHRYGSFPVLRKLPSAHDEAKWIVSEIKRLRAMTGNMTTFSDCAILIRSAHLSLLIENALGKAGIPYRMVGGYRFFDRDEIRTLLDYLRTISRPENNAALSAIINVPSRKIGDKTVKELQRLADERDVSLWVVIDKITKGELAMKKKFSRPAEQNLCKLVSLIKEAKKRMMGVSAESTPKFLLDFCIKTLAYKEYLQRKYPEEEESRWANVEELVGQAADIAASAPTANGKDLGQSLPEVEGFQQMQQDGNEEALASFLANITLSSDLQAAEDGQEQDFITISTIHSAKGLEWPVVFIPAVYDGSIPHSRAEDTDEERRLLYVAMTRAQALLYLTCPLRQSRTDTGTTLSLFLPQKLHRHFIQIGPNFTDKLVREMAHILRRDPPSEEELIKGLKSLSDRESSRDNLWPADGSAKPRQWWDFEDENAAKKVSRNAVNEDGLRVPQGLPNQYDSSRAGGTRVGTTMTSSNSFTIASASAGFSTAAQHLKLGRSSQMNFEATSTSAQGSFQNGEAGSKTKKRKAKAAAGQGSLVNFIARGVWAPVLESKISTSLPEHELPSYVETRHTSASPKIPSDLTFHKISARPAPLKRLLPLQEMSNAKRKYVFLSSSPTHEACPDLAYEGSHQSKGKVATGKEDNPPSTSVSVRTMHTTSMDILQQQQAGGGRKTYGVRRMMNGWENRKNK
jgi:DNA helicase II / ATP-dependent DNA helicase PcrA